MKYKEQLPSNTFDDTDYNIKSIFDEAQKQKGKKGDGRCVVCGGVFQRGECIECGHNNG